MDPAVKRLKAALEHVYCASRCRFVWRKFLDLRVVIYLGIDEKFIVPARNKQVMQPSPPPNVSSSPAPQVGQIRSCCEGGCICLG
jgi:hypothetical protein